jgi:hypothetical protein
MHNRLTVIDKSKPSILHGSTDVLQKLRDLRLRSANTRGN